MYRVLDIYIYIYHDGCTTTFQLGGHMQSFMFATWCPPRDRLMVSRLVSRQDRVESSFDGGVFRMDWFDLRERPLPADAPVVFVLPGVVGQGTNVSHQL